MLTSDPCRATNRPDCLFPATATLVQWNSWKSSEGTDPGKLALLVNQSQQVAGFHGQEVHDFPVVVKSDVGPGDVFPLVLLLFLSEDVVHEELLQLLVGKVDQKLLEAARGSDLSYKTPSSRSQSVRGEIVRPVSVEVLESKYVKQSEGQEGGFGGFGQIAVDDTVDFANNPYEEFVVDRLQRKHI